MPDFLLIMFISLFLGLAAGAIMFRADFCMTSAFRDLFLFRSTALLAALLVLITVSSLLFEVVRQFGAGVRYPFPGFGPPSFTHFIGGFLFGLGMVLAGGCVVGVLYKLGSGCRLCLWALAGLLIGSGIYSEIYPFWNTLAAKLALSQSITLPQLIGLSPSLFVGALTVLTLALLWKRTECFRATSSWRAVDGYLAPCLAALLLVVIGLLSLLLLGLPLGVTTTYAKLFGTVEQWFFPAHFSGLDFFKRMTLDVPSPLTGRPLLGGPGPGFDGIAAFQYPLIIGIVVGSALSAWRLGEWKFVGKAPLRQKLWVLFGGSLMGLASRMAAGCNVNHLWFGLPIFALSSLLFALGLFPGAWLGGKVLLRWVFPVKNDKEVS